MKFSKKILLPILLTGIWINVSITIGWIIILERYWIEKYESLNLIFPTGMTNNIVWMLWGFMLATLIFFLSKKFNLIQTTIIAWFAAFLMMWVLVGNIGVLPTGMLWFNVPLTFLITYIGVWICEKTSAKWSYQI